jgi:hypothetical protein
MNSDPMDVVPATKKKTVAQKPPAAAPVAAGKKPAVAAAAAKPKPVPVINKPVTASLTHPTEGAKTAAVQKKKKTTPAVAAAPVAPAGAKKKPAAARASSKAVTAQEDDDEKGFTETTIRTLLKYGGVNKIRHNGKGGKAAFFKTVNGMLTETLEEVAAAVAILMEDFGRANVTEDTIRYVLKNKFNTVMAGAYPEPKGKPRPGKGGD